MRVARPLSQPALPLSLRLLAPEGTELEGGGQRTISEAEGMGVIASPLGPLLASLGRGPERGLSALGGDMVE